jgi:hypothetical protein
MSTVTPVDRTEDIVMPAQRGAVAPPADQVDHVRVHARSCWWDHTECRWQCAPVR